MSNKFFDMIKAHADSMRSQPPPKLDPNTTFFNQIIKPTLYENWPIELQFQSFPTSCIELTFEEMDYLGATNVEFGEGYQRYYSLNDDQLFSSKNSLGYKIIRQMIRFNKQEFFVKLGSRGAKDALTTQIWPATDVLKILDNLTACSERINDDLLLMRMNNYKATILIREWIDRLSDKNECRVENEWRCFIKARKLIGISQYHYQQHIGCRFKLMSPNTRDAIMDYIKNNIIPDLHINDVVVDIYLSEDGPKLIEINPFCNMADPCLFKWGSQYELTTSDGAFFRINSD